MASIRAMAQTAAAGRVCPRAGMVGAATVGRRGIEGGNTVHTLDESDREREARRRVVRGP